MSTRALIQLKSPGAVDRYSAVWQDGYPSYVLKHLMTNFDLDEKPVETRMVGLGENLSHDEVLAFIKRADYYYLVEVQAEDQFDIKVRSVGLVWDEIVKGLYLNIAKEAQR